MVESRLDAAVISAISNAVIGVVSPALRALDEETTRLRELIGQARIQRELDADRIEALEGKVEDLLQDLAFRRGALEQ